MLQKFARASRSLETLLVETIAIGITLVAFSVFLGFVGKNPLAVYADMVDGAFGSSFSFQSTLVRAAPLMLTALCTAVPARVGLVVGVINVVMVLILVWLVAAYRVAPPLVLWDLGRWVNIVPIVAMPFASASCGDENRTLSPSTRMAAM